MIEQMHEDVKLKFKDHPSRYEHVLGVIQTAVSLAVRYGTDSHKAYIAALFHDYTKYDTLNEQTSVLSKSVTQQYKAFPVMYHALSAAEILKVKYKINDEEILDAIRYHVSGRVGMTTLDKIILVADKTEPSRKYPLVKELRKKSLMSLDDTIKAYLTDLINYPKEMHVDNQTYIKEIIKSIGE